MAAKRASPLHDYHYQALPPDAINSNRVSQRKSAFTFARRTALVALVVGCIYFWYRCQLVKDGAGVAKLASRVALLIELGYALQRLPLYLLFFSAGGDDAPSLSLKGDKVPRVDVFITYCGEGLDIVLDTLHAACSLDYPRHGYRVVVLDDSCSDVLRDTITALNSRFPNLLYSTRGNRPKVHSKAANMNHGLAFVDGLPGGAYEYCAVLDADNIPEPCWLRRLVPHLVADEMVGCVSTSARAYNVPRHDAISTALEPRLVYGVVLPVLAAAGNPVVIGTGFVARRSAVNGVGGFPTESVIDDGLLGIKLRSLGWKVVWAQEELQWNLVTETLAGQIKQRQRWSVGTVNNSVFAAITKDKHWKLSKRLQIIIPHLLNLLPTISVPFSMLALPLLLLSQQPLLHFQHESQRRWVLLLGVADVVAQYAHGFAVSRFSRRPLPILYYAHKQWVLPYFVPAILRHYMPAKNPMQQAGFQAASADRVEAHKDTQLGSIGRRWMTELPLWGTGVNVLSFFLVVLSVVVVASRSTEACHEATCHDAATQFVTTIGWPPLVLILSTYVANGLTFVSAIVHPRPGTSREELVERDPTTGIAYPTQEAQQVYEMGGRSSEWGSVLFTVYIIACILITGLH